MGASFAFVQVLDALGDERLELPEPHHLRGLQGSHARVTPVRARGASATALPEIRHRR
jgi:hypothetical protein